MAKNIVAAEKRAPKSTIIYGLCDPTTGELRYVGKTADSMRGRLVAHLGAARLNPGKRYCLHWIRSILDVGLVPEIFEIETVPAGGDWQEAETFWISMFKALGARLTNLTVGGEGALGAVTSEETRAKLSALHKGRQFSESHRKALSDSRIGMKFSESHLASMSKVRIGKKHKPRTHGMGEAQKEKLRQAALRQWADPDNLAHISKVRTGVPCTESAKVKIGQKSKDRWADPEYKKRLSEIQKVAQRGVARQNGERMRQKWADPEYRQRMLDARAEAREKKQKSAVSAN